MSTPSIGDCISTGVEKLKKNPLYMIVGLLVAMIVGAIPLGLLIGPMMVGFMMGLQKMDDGEEAAIGDVFQGFQKLVPALIVAIVGGILVMIGFILLVIPGLIIMPVPFIGLVLVAKGENDGIAALKRAFGYYKGALAPTLITFIVLMIINSVANMIPLAGLIVGPIIIAGLFHYVNGLLGAAGATDSEAKAQDAAAAATGGDSSDAPEDKPAEGGHEEEKKEEG